MVMKYNTTLTWELLLVLNVMEGQWNQWEIVILILPLKNFPQGGAPKVLPRYLKMGIEGDGNEASTAQTVDLGNQDL